MKNINIEKDNNGKYVQYGNGNSTVTICIKAYFLYNGETVERFIPVFVGTKYGCLGDFDSIRDDETLERRIDFQRYLLEKYNDLSPDNIRKWKECVSKLHQKNTKVDMAFRKLLKNLDKKVLAYSLVEGSTNPQKIIQGLRNEGFCIITERSHDTYVRLVSGIKLASFENELIPLSLRRRVLDFYNCVDALSGEKLSEKLLIVEHKFPEERWQGRSAETNENMTDEEIKKKFQLLTGQYNMVKREACKKCGVTQMRQTPFGINYFYEGDETWDCINQFGEDAEQGCIGCGWYDVAKWKELLNIALENDDCED